MFFFNRNFDAKAIRALLRFYSLARKNHYEVLNLRKNCSDKEIKEAFIQMSKEYHPDKNKDSKAQEQFVRIVEAYNVLGKPGSRAQYDHMTQIETNTHTSSAPSYTYRTHVPYNLRNHPQYSYYYDTQPPKAANRKENVSSKKFPNYIIIAMCTGVALLGVILQVFVIRNLYVSQRREAQEKTKRLAEELERVRASAVTNGNEVLDDLEVGTYRSMHEGSSMTVPHDIFSDLYLQTRILLDKIVAAANANVATASLGQALASEKK